MTILTVKGVDIHKGYLDPAQQKQLVDVVRAIAKAAPLFQPEIPFGRKMSVQMTAAGQFGWFSDRSGYRYIPHHPNGQPWPAIPAKILRIWEDITGMAQDPQCCLVNYYGTHAKMGMHQDKDEADFRWPVISISLGDDARFRIGNTTKGGPTEKIWLQSGDVAVLGGEARLAYHGIDKIREGSSSLLAQGGRINLTLRVVE